MPRKPLLLRAFNKGLALKGDCVGEPSFMRLTGFKFSSRPGALETRGGFADWDTSTDFTFLNGIKKWYRKDGGYNFFVFGTSGVNRQIWSFHQHNKTTTSLFSLASAIVDDRAPVLWVNCNNQMLVLPLGGNIRPYTIKLLGLGSGIIAGELGLDPPTIAPFVSAQGASGSGTNTAPRDQIRDGVYLYAYSYCYGTRENPEEYGESALSPISSLQYPATVIGYVGAGDYNGINQIQGWGTVITSTGIVRKIKVYRSKRDETALFLLTEITEVGRDFYNDTTGDSSIDTSEVPPLFTGLPYGMRCALWHPTLRRLFWFGEDGYFHYSAAGFPDINPVNQKLEVGSLGYKGNAIFLIRSSIYTLKEDGIYLIQGEAPNYISTKVSNVQCFCRATMAEMPDGAYFLGIDSGAIKVYRFNGNSAEPISEAVNRLLPPNKSSVFQKAFGKRVGDEYWLSLMIVDKRYCAHPVPYNNVIFMYDYRYQEWSGSLPCQASSIEVLDGPGDSGEVFITESDVTDSAAKGNIFRFEKRNTTCNQTIYNGGPRAYNKTTTVSGVISYGVIPGLAEEENTLQEATARELRIRVRGHVRGLPLGTAYKDDSELEEIIPTFTAAENLRLQGNDLDVSGDDSCLVGGGKADFALCKPTLVEDYIFTLVDDKLRTGYIFEVLFDRATRFIEIEALECKFSPTSKK